MDHNAEVIQSLADTTRLRLLHLLGRTGEICVCELVDALAVPQYNVSRHLRVLQNAEWVEDRKVGKWVYYRLSPALKPYQRSLLQAVIELRDERRDFQEDEKRAGRRLKLRRGGLCCIGLVSEIGEAPSSQASISKQRKAGKKT
jgi:ArsR family transcriptional regulator, arsenate/arsenite/antimonite-responsive transcriptional repressor